MEHNTSNFPVKNTGWNGLPIAKTRYCCFLSTASHKRFQEIAGMMLLEVLLDL